MAMELIVIAGPDKGRRFPVTPSEPLLVGRGKNTQTRLNDPHVSRQHCQVEIKEGRIVLVDSGSVGGTYVNGQPAREQELKPGDIIQVGETRLQLDQPGMADQATIPPPDQARRGPSLLPRPMVASPGAGASPPPLAGPVTPAVTPPAAPAVPAASGPARPVTTAAAPPPVTAAPPAAAPLPAERLQELAGTHLAHFDIGAPLARGRSGLVFLARDDRAEKDHRTVALKVLWPEFSRDDAEVKRFIRAMKTMIPLRHPHLVNTYNAGRTGPYCWIAMEYVEGESVTQILKRGGIAGPTDWRYALRVATHVARGLVFAHFHHIIHRDVTPQNILVRAADKVAKLGDLMLAKAQEGSQAQQITRAGEILGDLRFMAPERTAGGNAVVDGRADIYSLGATFYALVAGRPPLEGDSPVRTILKIRQEKPIPPRKAQPALPDRLDAAILKTLEKRPEDRFQTAAELLSELETIAKANGVGV
jgi:tRNA A-37 threonylcarbamoyl transferase component Bud32